MKFPEPRTFFSATSPVILANWVFGMGIFEYPIGHPRPRISLCWSIAHFFLFLNFIALTKPGNLTQMQSSTVSTSTYNIFISASVISVIVFLYLGHAMSKNVTATLRRLNTVNKMLRKYEIPEEYGLTFRYQVIQLTGAFLFVSMILALNTFWIADTHHFRMKHFGYLAAQYYIPTCSFIVDCTFANLIRYIGKRFQYLNENLVQSSSRKNNPNAFFQGSELDGYLQPTILEIHANPLFVRLADKRWMVQLIWNSRKIHQELSSAARTLNQAFGVQILLSTVMSSILITAILYEIYRTIITTTSSIMKMVIMVSWLIFHTVKFLFVVFVCSMTSNQAQKMGELIHQVDKPTIDRQVREEIHAFSLLLMQNPLKFTASGFFTLDYQMIRSMVGAVTTYLVIMIQLRNIDNPNSVVVNATVQAINSTY